MLFRSVSQSRSFPVFPSHEVFPSHDRVHSYGVELCQAVFKSYSNCIIGDISKYKGVYKEDLPARSPYVHNISNLAMHLTDHAFLSLVGCDVEPEHKNYIKLDPIDVSHFNLPKRYAVVATGFTSETREWNPESVKETTDYLVSKNIVPVYIGKSYTPSFITENKNEAIKGTFKADYSNGLNLIDKTTLLEVHSIIARTEVAIGLDNGLVPHLAGMTDVPIVAGFTTVRPEHRLPYRHGVKGWNCEVVAPTKEELACAFCQSDMTFAEPTHSFTKCYYSDFKCLDAMSSNKWIEALKKVGI